jgi:hypothetical protein
MSARTMDFPSVLDLGRLAGAVSRRSAAYDTARGCAEQEAHAGGTLCITLLDSLQGIIAARRAETLADVAAQLVVAFVVTDYLSGELPEEEIERNTAMLRRIVLSALPVVAAAAKVDLAELDADYLLGFTDRAFPPVMAEAQS